MVIGGGGGGELAGAGPLQGNVFSSPFLVNIYNFSKNN